MRSIRLQDISSTYKNKLHFYLQEICRSWNEKTVQFIITRRTDAFELWCWRRLLRVPRTARRSNQSILKEISPGCTLEGVLLKLQLQYFGHLMWRTDCKIPWYWERLRAGGEGDHRGWEGWMASPTQWTWVWVDSGNWWWTGKPGVQRFMGLHESDMTQLLNWKTKLKNKKPR